jgi:hypothetical protein
MNEDARVAISVHLSCLECGREWTDPQERWRMYATIDVQPELGLFCADCAAFEFGA